MSEPWYRNGLRSACTDCGNCCSGTPGTVLVSEVEIAELAESLDLGLEEFRQIHTRSLRKGDVSLREKSNGECTFYRSGAGEGSVRGCSVYADRPRQCRTWPFWSAVVHSPERWAEESEACPGMNRGALHSTATVLFSSENDGTRGSGSRG